MRRRSESTSVSHRRKPALYLAVALALAVTGCSTAKPPGRGDLEVTRIDGTDVIVRGRLDVAGASAAVGIYDNYFQPNLLSARPGTTVRLSFQSFGLGSHNVSVPHAAIDKDVTPGQSVDVEFTLPASGRVAFFCRFHRDESGMIGAVDVRTG